MSPLRTEFSRSLPVSTASFEKCTPPCIELLRLVVVGEAPGQFVLRRMPPPCTELLREGVAEPWTEVSRGRPAPQFHMDMPPWREFSRETSGLGCLPTPQFHIETPLCCDESRDGAGVPATDGGPLQSHMPELDRLSVLSPGCTDRRGLKFCPPCIDGFGVSPDTCRPIRQFQMSPLDTELPTSTGFGFTSTVAGSASISSFLAR